MINQAIKDYDVDPKSSFLIGDSQRDVDAAEAAGVKAIYLQVQIYWILLRLLFSPLFILCLL